MRLSCLFLFLFLFLFLLTACQPAQQKANKNPITASGATDISKLKLNLPDTVAHLLRQSALTDTFEYVQWAYADSAPYPFIYFKAGKIFDEKQKSALALYSLNDTTVVYERYTDSVGQWKQTGSQQAHIDGFSPAYFRVHYADYNFDGNKDMYTVFYNSMGIVYGFGYILTYDPVKHALKLHPETIDIADPYPDRKTRTVVSEMLEDRWSDVWEVMRYKWVNDSLRHVSTKKKK